MTTSWGEREANRRWSRRREKRRGREDGRQRRGVKMRHGNKPVRTKGGGLEDGHVTSEVAPCPVLPLYCAYLSC